MCSSLLPLPASRGPSQHTSPGAPELWDEEWDQCYGMGVKHPANDRGTPPTAQCWWRIQTPDNELTN